MTGSLLALTTEDLNRRGRGASGKTDAGGLLATEPLCCTGAMAAPAPSLTAFPTSSPSPVKTCGVFVITKLVVSDGTPYSGSSIRGYNGNLLLKD
jgi:hypothetical protein